MAGGSLQLWIVYYLGSLQRGRTVAIGTSQVFDANGKTVAVATGSALILSGRPATVTTELTPPHPIGSPDDE